MVYPRSCICEFQGGLAIVCARLAHWCCLGHKLYQVGKLLTPRQRPMHVTTGSGLALSHQPLLSHEVWDSSSTQQRT